MKIVLNKMLNVANYKMYNKKAQGLPLNVIIIAILVLIVLVVIIAIFAGKIGIFSREVAECKAKGGRCESKTTGCETNEVPVAGLCGEDEVCCIPI